jgi:hypothetical protein
MKKAADLRAHLTECVPFVAADPTKLLMFIERGTCASRLGGGLSFEYRYDINLVLLDYPHHADTLMIPLLAWIAVNQPSLLQHPDKIGEAIRFEAELIDNDTADISITLALVEAVVVVEQGGEYQATHSPEPPLLDLGGAPGWELYVKGARIL